jgi:hypothetical protein
LIWDEKRDPRIRLRYTSQLRQQSRISSPRGWWRTPGILPGRLLTSSESSLSSPVWQRQRELVSAHSCAAQQGRQIGEEVERQRFRVRGTPSLASLCRRRLSYTCSETIAAVIASDCLLGNLEVDFPFFRVNTFSVDRFKYPSPPQLRNIHRMSFRQRHPNQHGR